MRTVFIQARSNADITLPASYIKRLPESILLATTAQHVHKIRELKRQLETAGKNVTLAKGAHSRYPGQIVGCDAPKAGKKAVLFVGTGSFHPDAFTDAEVFTFNPFSRRLRQAKKAHISRRAALAKFYASEHVGVIISLKPGQLSLRRALELKKRYQDKHFYFLLFDTVSIAELENFSFIQSFVNTACPRIIEDTSEKKFVNLSEIL